MRTPDLCDRVIAVAHEHPLVKAGGALALDAVERPAGRWYLGRELLEEQATERPRIPRVAREHRALDGLRQVDEAEDGPVEVREVGAEEILLLGGERLDRVTQGGRDRSPARGGPAYGPRCNP
jgi:hypothetical protein